MSRIAKAAAVGFAIAAIGTVLSYAFPNTNTYISLPGYLVAFVLNGGGHESYLGPTGWNVIPIVSNVLIYSLLIYCCLAVRDRLTAHSIG